MTNREQIRTGKDRFANLLDAARRRELQPLLWLLACGFALFAFLKIGSEMREGETHALDNAILLALRVPGHTHTPIGPPWLEQAARDVTSLGSLTVLTIVTLAVLGYLLMLRQRREALLLAIAVPGGLLLSSGLKALYGRPRPELLPEAVAQLNASFPSGHAMLSAVAYFTLAALLARSEQRRSTRTYLYAIALTVAGLVGLSRIYLGLHWPSDVVAGWCVGASWAVFCRLAVDYVPGLSNRLRARND